MASNAFVFDPLATYDVFPEESKSGIVGPSRLIAGQLFVSRHGTLDLLRAMGEVREQIIYLAGTDILLGRLEGDRLILARTGAAFTLLIRPE